MAEGDIVLVVGAAEGVELYGYAFVVVHGIGNVQQCSFGACVQPRGIAGVTFGPPAESGHWLTKGLRDSRHGVLGAKFGPFGHEKYCSNRSNRFGLCFIRQR